MTAPTEGLSGFHPAVARWFAEALGRPTPPQRRGWAAIRDRRHTLIAAPTGSGKTLAAFLSALDDLLVEGVAAGGTLPDEVRVVYVSPLKALSADIHTNLVEPRRGIRRLAEAMGLEAPRITAAVRTGDTPQSERAAMLRRPPHILVTTPESLYLLLTAERSREMLRTARTVIVDEIHAVIGSRRGSHLALSLERLEHLTGPLQRIGLSATQKPIAEVARFLVGAARLDPRGEAECAVVDEGHSRALDLGLELPGSPLEAVMSHEVWEEVFARLTDLITAHGTTLVFVNTRRMAERVAKQLSDRLGEDAVTAHHGSLAREQRHDAEARLKAGSLRALVATASLELGIDIGHVDLVCQLGTPRAIGTFLQRVGRSGHTVAGTPKGRLFPLSRDELVESLALLRAVRRGELDRLIMPPEPLDVLAQQVVAETAAEDWSEDDLFALARRAYPYRALSRKRFDQVVGMLAEGYTTRRGRRGTLVHRDGVNRRLRGRRGARLAAITAGGAIPDNADYRVVLEPEDTFLGTINEDFAIESSAGDVFQLGNASWRILQVGPGVVRVADAHGEPPNIPFWLGEAPGRTAELSSEVGALRAELDGRLEDPAAAAAWLEAELEVSRAAAEQAVFYLRDARLLLGALPTQRTLVLERFFDESGGMQLVLHAPFGSRVNRAWGLALRKKFCRQFNFELQAAATEEGLLLSLGPQHSFPLEDVFRYLHPETVRDTLVQALLDSPLFPTRWRWNATISLAVLRFRGGRKVPPPLQRMEADDLMAAAFPDAAACLENIGGDREIPDHPLVRQTIEDCLTEAMDLPSLARILEQVRSGAIACVARDTPEPSPLCHELLNARPYAFLDDAPLEERRARAVQTRRALDPSSAAELGALDPEAIARVRDEAWPDPRDPDELHDALLTAGFLSDAEIRRGRGEDEGASWEAWLAELVGTGRARRIRVRAAGTGRPLELWIATERLEDAAAAWGPAVLDGLDRSGGSVEEGEARRRILGGRLELLGPATEASLAVGAGWTEGDTSIALHALEGQGVVLRGTFTPGADAREWCDRRLLARIHRYTLNRLRAEIEPVAPADFMRFLFSWQRVSAGAHAAGPEGLAEVVRQLDGYELAAGAWEPDVLSLRLEGYDPAWLDSLCLTGRVTWGRLTRPARSAEGEDAVGPAAAGPVRSTPVALALRENLPHWLALAGAGEPAGLSGSAEEVLAALRARGPSFFQELVAAAGETLLPTQAEAALGELAALGLVTSDGFTGLRALLTPSARRGPLHPGMERRRRATTMFGVESAGRWSTIPRAEPTAEPTAVALAAAREAQAMALLRRYGVVFRRLLARETGLAPWRELATIYRRLEARGEIRGGRFVSGMSGEQFALPEAVGALRKVRRSEPTAELLGLSAADPLNLAGIVTPGERIPAIGASRVVYRDGVPIAARVGKELRALVPLADEELRAARAASVRRRLSPTLRGYLGRAG